MTHTNPENKETSNLTMTLPAAIRAKLVEIMELEHRASISNTIIHCVAEYYDRLQERE